MIRADFKLYKNFINRSKIQSEFYYSPSGEVKIEKYFDIDSNEPNVAKKILLNYCERVLFFQQ